MPIVYPGTLWSGVGHLYVKGMTIPFDDIDEWINPRIAAALETRFSRQTGSCRGIIILLPIYGQPQIAFGCPCDEV